MPLALILSSFVAANRIGGGAQQVALTALGFEAFLAPTVLLGRNPAKGAAGQAVDPAIFQGFVDGMEAEGLFARTDLMITGYFASAAQAAIAAEAVAAVRAASPGVTVVTDPILGDDPGGLYVMPEVADAVGSVLAPVADWITPNAWELARLAGRRIGTAADAVEAAQDLGVQALVTSVPTGPDEIGLLLCEGRSATLYAHPRKAAASNGTGDLVTAVFAAGLVQGLAPQEAGAAAAAAAAHMVDAAAALGDLPLAQLVRALREPAPGLRMEHLAGSA